MSSTIMLLQLVTVRLQWSTSLGPLPIVESFPCQLHLHLHLHQPPLTTEPSRIFFNAPSAFRRTWISLTKCWRFRGKNTQRPDPSLKIESRAKRYDVGVRKRAASLGLHRHLLDFEARLWCWRWRDSAICGLPWSLPVISKRINLVGRREWIEPRPVR